MADEPQDIIEVLEQHGVDPSAPDLPAIRNRPSRQDVFLAFEAQLSGMMPERYFEYLWDLAEEIGRPKPIPQMLRDQTHLHRLALDARSLVQGRLARFRETAERLRDRYELSTRRVLAGQKTTIDLIRATICEEHPDYVETLEKLAVLEALSTYTQGLCDLCFSRQITAKERSERDRAHFSDEHKVK